MKTANLYFIYCTVIGCLTSCVEEKQYKDVEYFSYQSFPVNNQLKGEILPMEIISKPRGVACKDSLLLINNTAVENFVYCYNLNTYQKIGEFIPFGSGPNEMLSVGSIAVENNDVWLFTVQPSSLIRYEIDQFRQPAVIAPKEKYVIDDGMHNSILLLNTGDVLTTSHRRVDSRFSFYTNQGEFIKEKGEYPCYGRELTPNERFEAFLCSMIELPNQTILLAYKNTDLLEIYDLEGNLIKRKQGPEQFFPSVQEQDVPNGKMVFGKEDAKGAYFSPIVVGEEIWITYLGKNLVPKDRHSLDHLLSDKIFVFNQSLDPLRIISLDIPVYGLAVNSENRTIYALSIRPDFVAVKFKY